MEFHQLIYFLSVADNGSISQASKRLLISQPAISTAIKDLEKELGFTLFNRTGKRLHLNENGVFYAKRVRKTLSILRDAQETVLDDLSARENTIHCTLAMPLSNREIGLFRDFHQRYPHISLQLSLKDTTQFTTTPDLEIIGSTKDLSNDDTAVALDREKFLIIMPKHHPLACKHPLYLRDLKNEPFLLGKNNPMRSTVDSMFEEAGYAPEIAGEFQLYSDILGLVLVGMGITIGMEHCWLDCYQSEDLVARECDDVKRERTIYARIPEDTVASSATDILLKFLKENEINRGSRSSLD